MVPSFAVGKKRPLFRCVTAESASLEGRAGRSLVDTYILRLRQMSATPHKQPIRKPNDRNLDRDTPERHRMHHKYRILFLKYLIKNGSSSELRADVECSEQCRLVATVGVSFGNLKQLKGGLS